jgi:hypothetical protein
MKRVVALAIVATFVLPESIASASPGTEGPNAPSVGSAGTVHVGGLQSEPAGEWSHRLAGYEDYATDGVTGMVIKAVTAPPMTCRSRFEGIAIGAGYSLSGGNLDYFAGVVATCVDGEAMYELNATVGDAEARSAEVAAGDLIQVVIDLNCDAEICDVSASATNLDAEDTKVVMDGTSDLRHEGLFGAFPVYREEHPYFSRVPNFGSTPIRGCLLNGEPMEDPTRVKRRRRGDKIINQIFPSRHVDLSFKLNFRHH